MDQLDALQRNKDLAPLLTGVDVMVAGGGHERMGDSTDIPVAFNGHDADFIADAYPIVTAGADGKPTLIVTTDTEYSYVGRLVVNFDTNGELILSSLDPAINGAWAAAPAIVESVYNNGQTAAQIVAASPMATRVKAITDAINTVIQTKDGTVYGYTKVYLEGDRVFGRTQEVNLGDITADANAAKVKTALGLPATAAVFSLKNGGGSAPPSAPSPAVGPRSRRLPTPSPTSQPGPSPASMLKTPCALTTSSSSSMPPPPACLASSTTPPVSAVAQPFKTVVTPRSATSASPTRPAAPSVRKSARPSSSTTTAPSSAKIVENGAVLPGAPASITCVALNFTANGGDGYPIKYLDPAATPPNQSSTMKPATSASSLMTGLFPHPSPGTSTSPPLPSSPPPPWASSRPSATTSTVRHNTPAKAYDQADTPVALDTRIQQIPARADTVLFSPVEIWRLGFFGNTAGSGANQGVLEDADSDGVNNLFEFAFGTSPVSNVSGPPYLIYTGTLAGNGTLALTGQPITRFEPTLNNVDFRAVFIRRKDYISAGLTYTPQFTANLTTWQNSSAIPTVLADDGTWQVVSVPYTRSIGGRKAQFFRIDINIAP